MRIRTQLFLGTAILVFALVGTGWWLQIRQLRALETELSEVAVSVGAHLLQTDGPTFFWRKEMRKGVPQPENSSVFVWNSTLDDSPAAPPPPPLTTKRVFVHGSDPSAEASRRCAVSAGVGRVSNAAQ